MKGTVKIFKSSYCFYDNYYESKRTCTTGGTLSSISIPASSQEEDLYLSPSVVPSGHRYFFLTCCREGYC